MSNNYGPYLLIRLQAVPMVTPILEYFLTVRGAVHTAIQARGDTVLTRRPATVVSDSQSDEMDEDAWVLAVTILGRGRNNLSAIPVEWQFRCGKPGL